MNFTSYIRLIKIEHSIFGLTLLFSSVFLCGVRPSGRNLLLLVMATVSARTAALILNRWLDRRIDARNPRTSGRELVSGAVGAAEWDGSGDIGRDKR